MRRSSLRLSLSFIPLLGVCYGLFLATPAHAAGSASFERRDYQMTIQKSGDVTVVEHWQIHFTGGPFHHAFLQISLVKTTGIVFGQAQGDGVANQTVAQTTDIQGEPAERVAWDFAAAQDATRAFDIPYTIHGAMQVSASQAWFDWHYFDGPSGAAIPITASMITVTLPTATAAADLHTQAVSPDGTVATTTLNPTTVQAQAGGTVANHVLEMQIAFPRAELAASVARQPWQTDNTPPTLEAQQPSGATNGYSGGDNGGYSGSRAPGSWVGDFFQNILGSLACLLLPLIFVINLAMRAVNYNGGPRTSRWIGGNRFFGPYYGGPFPPYGGPFNHGPFTNGGPFMGGGPPPMAPPPSAPPPSGGGGGGGASGFS